MKTLLLTQSDVRSLVTMDRAVAAVEAAFAAHGRGETLMPTKVYIELDKHCGDFRAMPAYLDGAAGLKWVNCHSENPTRHGLPTVRGMYILSDPATADALAVMDATWLTAARTGASAAVATKHLARTDSKTVGFVGSGAQARTILAALQVSMDDLEVVAADLNPEWEEKDQVQREQLSEYRNVLVVKTKSDLSPALSEELRSSKIDVELSATKGLRANWIAQVVLVDKPPISRLSTLPGSVAPCSLARSRTAPVPRGGGGGIVASPP